MTTSDPKGSIWRKWDLHFHTPASFDYENMSVTAKELVEALILNGISVVAVTDHHVIDAKRISEMREYAAGRITIFPGIELRSELGGSKCVHYIGIFPENCDVDELWRELDVKLEIAKQLKSRTNDEIYVKYQDGFNSIHKLGGVISIHAGNKSNSFEGIGKQNHQLAIKEDLLRGYIDILEVGNSKQVTGYLNHVFPDVFEKSEKTRPIIVCSDNHNIKNYDISSPLWIKADPNFFGLKQILIEPQDRVFLGKEPESQIKKRERSTHIIRNIEIKKKTNSTATHNWFSTKLTLNDGLIAIIGNKGSGKSALADIFGLLGNTRQSDKFSFLKATRFLNTKSRLAQEYNAVLYWESEDTSDKDLNEGCFPDDIETVKYIPQNYLEDICSELEDGKFNKELQEVIFSHIEIPDRLQTQSLEELLKIKKQQSDRRRETLVVSLKEVDRQIAELQYQTTISNKNALEARFNAKKKELDALDLAKPVEKQKPAENTVPKETASQIEALQGQVKSISEAIQNNTEESAMLAMKIAGVDRLSGKVSNFQRQYTSFLEDCQEDVAFLDIDLGDLLKIEVNLKPLHAKRQSYLDRRAKIIAAIDPNNAESLPAKLIVINKKLLEIQNELDGPNREYQSYLKELSDWETKRAAILGSENDTESFEGLKAVILKISEQYPKQIEELETKRESLSREIYDIIKESLKEYQSVYSPVQKFIDQQKDDAHRMQIEANIVQDKFSEKFFSLIDRSRKGSFRGEEGMKTLEHIIQEANFQDPDSLVTFANSIISRLFDSQNEVQKTSDQLKKGVEVKEVYDLVFSLEYLIPRFELKWQGKPLDQLSPGERGNLLLTFYLLIDKRDCPLIIDQPEENLDNQTIVTVLVPCVREAKKRRQIIMVTHNPNLALVCDAEQIIHASIDKTHGNRITYTSGAIENPTINKLLLDVLEGTKPAFDIRDAKYESVTVK